MKQFTYISEDDGQEHEARTIDWDDLLQDKDVCSASLDDESACAIASMQQTIGALTIWRDTACVDGLAPRIVESCTCPVCVAMRSLEVAIEHIYRIFE